MIFFRLPRTGLLNSGANAAFEPRRHETTGNSVLSPASARTTSYLSFSANRFTVLTKAHLEIP